jgi:hypothetical protein
MHNLLLAVAVTATPFEDYVERADKEARLPELRQYWISMGVLEEGEWLLRSVWSMESDLADLHYRLENTPVDAPPVQAHHHLPDHDTAWRNYMDGVNYERFLEDQRDWLLPGPEMQDLELILTDCRKRQAIWYAVYKCTGAYFGQEGRRWHLNELRKTAGEDVFYGRQRWPNGLPEAAMKDPSWRIDLSELWFN